VPSISDLLALLFEVDCYAIYFVVLLSFLLCSEVGQVYELGEFAVGTILLSFSYLSLHHCLVVEVEVDVRVCFPRSCLGPNRSLLDWV
jgi:hypothetical protein